ncbi:MAG: hypothetical protein NTV01_06685 [Bacteroidia bacterium]|nr:hypothetical protein [Bacteroidia bacterium]
MGGDFQDIHNPNTLFTGISGQVYTLKWTLSGGCLENSDMVFIAFISNGDMTDSRDSKTYRTVVIGNQEWMAENLNYLANGSYTYSGNIENASIYGRLYNWNSAKSACPSGWHLPTDAEWRQFEGFLGMDESTTLLEWYRGLNEGGMLKEQGTLYWRTPNTGATDITGFTARPGGYRSPTGIFGGIYTQAGFWTSTENVNGKAIYRALHNFKSQIGRDWYDQGYGFSVRCVKN